MDRRGQIDSIDYMKVAEKLNYHVNPNTIIEWQ